MNEVSLNYYHTNVVIPNMIIANKEFFVNKIIKDSRNMEYFITKDTYNKACSKKGATNNPIECNLTANETAGYFVVFTEFSADYGTDTKAIAVAVKGDKVRYFTYEVDNNKYFVGEYQLESDHVGNHLNYGQTSEYKMSYFAGKVASYLEG